MNERFNDGNDENTDRTWSAAMVDAHLAIAEYDNAREWASAARATLATPLAAEMWTFTPDFSHVLLVRHRWRAWVPPGGKVEYGETPREAAMREVFEETGLSADALPLPGAVTVRSYSRDWSPTLGLSYVAIADTSTPLVQETGQPVAWVSLNSDWNSFFPEDAERMRGYVADRLSNRPVRASEGAVIDPFR